MGKNILDFLANFLGNKSNEKLVFSTKKQFFVLASILGLLSPWLLLNQLTGKDILDYYMILVPAIMGFYTAGKWVENGKK